MRIRITVPSHLGAYKLNRQARMASAKKLIERNIKLFAKHKEKVTSIILAVDDKEYIIRPKSEQKVLVDHAEKILNK